MTRPRVLDLFCGAGGAAMGYHRAGFDILGVDIKAQPRYPFPFLQGDALEVPLDGFDLVHASPPCQRYSRAAVLAAHQGGRRSSVDLVARVRARLVASGLPYVIENVEGAPVEGVVLCGSAFGLGVRRHRIMESSALILGAACQHARQGRPVGVYGRPGDTVQGRDSGTGRWVVGGRTARSVEEAQQALGIEWMTRWVELKEAIPPAYTEHIGRQLIRSLGRGAPP